MIVPDIVIRAATTGDAAAINDIYNAYVHTSTATFDTAEATLADRLAWLEEHGDGHPVLVVEQAGRVVAWGSLSRWANRCGWRHTVEVSTYVSADARGRGIGPRLLEALVALGRAHGHHALIAQIAADNEPSLKMAARAGFERVGTLREVGRKFDAWIDLAMLELIVNPVADDREETTDRD